MKSKSALRGSLAVLAALVPFASQDGRLRKLEWHTDLAKAVAIAKDTGRPLLVEFR